MRARDFLTRAGALVAGRWLHDGLRALLLLWLARADQRGWGLFVLGLGLAMMIRSLLALGLDQFTMRELAREPADQGPILAQMLGLKLVAGTLILGGLILLGLLWDWGIDQLAVVAIMAAAQVLEALCDTVFNLYRLKGLQVKEAAYTALAHCLGVAYGALALLLGWGIAWVASFVLLGSGLRLLLAVLLGMRQSMLPPLHGQGRSWLARSLPTLLCFVAISFLGTFYNQIQVFLIKAFWQVDVLAVYGAAAELTGGLAGLVSTLVVGGVLYPSLSQSAARDRARLAPEVRVYFWNMAACGLGVAFFFVTLGGELFLRLFGPSYSNGAELLLVMGPAVPLSFVNNLVIAAFLALRAERDLLWMHLAVAALALGLGLALIPGWGAGGAAWTLLACRGLMSILIIARAQQRLGIWAADQAKALGSGVLILAAGLGIFWAAGSRLAAASALVLYGLWMWRQWRRKAGQALPVQGQT